jgi:hypothetical protein
MPSFDFINQFYYENNTKANTLQHNSESDKPEKESDPKLAVPKKSTNFFKVFNKTKPTTKPRLWDHKLT